MVTKVYEHIIYEKKPPIAYVTLNRPEVMNALSKDLMLEAMDALKDGGWQDKEIRVIVLKGAGPCFSSGYDVTGGKPGMDGMQARAHLLKDYPFITNGHWDLFWNNPKPIIAQVHSYCLAGAMATAAFCDLCICSEDALFGYPWIRQGGPELACIWPWLLGMRKARELLYTGNLIDAQEAWRLGLVNKVVPGDKLEEEVSKLAQTISKVAVVANEYSKKLVNMAYELMGIQPTLERSYELEAVCNSASAESHPERAEFNRVKNESGLTAALRWSRARFAEEDAWWKERRKK